MKTKSGIIGICIVLMLAALACNLPFIAQDYAVQENGVGETGSHLPDGLTENYAPATDGFANPFSYSADQQAAQETYGDPTRFTIIFTSTGRQETWNYDTSGYSVVFRDGVKIAEKVETPQYQEEMYATTLSPDQFYSGMGVDEVVLSTGRSDITFVTLEGLDKDTRLMYLEGLSVGVVDGKVNFVEIIPSTTETRLSQADFAPVSQPSPASEISLTPEETANQGTHTYAVTMMRNDEILDEHSTTFTITFFEGGCLLGENEPYHSFTQIGTNQYQEDAEDPILITFNADGFSWTMTDSQLVTQFVFQD